MVRIGVLLPAASPRAGELLADVSALDAAGAHAVLVEGSGPESFVLLAAAAAITRHIKVGCIKGEVFAAGAFATLSWISGDRAMVFARGQPPERLTVQGVEPAEVWVEIAMPIDRMAWTETLAAQALAGAAGLIVPWIRAWSTSCATRTRTRTVPTCRCPQAERRRIRLAPAKAQLVRSAMA